jgi:uncharacterized small protein (DUF1192 family)
MEAIWQVSGHIATFSTPKSLDKVRGMFEDDLDPKTKKTARKNLEPMSIEELERYIVSMTDEIARVKAEIDRKKAHLAAASSFFKT